MVTTSQRSYGVEDPQDVLQYGVLVAPQDLSDRAPLKQRGFGGLNNVIQEEVQVFRDEGVGALGRRQRNHDH